MTPLDTRISPNFTWQELTDTSRSALLAKNREEAERFKAPLTALANELLEPLRAQFGPLQINSAFRGPSLNAAVNGRPGSQHLRGEAADIVPLRDGVTVEHMFRWVKASSLKFGQVIWECPSASSRWLHLSLGEPWRTRNNREALYFDGKTYTPR
jgi:hypothetical protein